MSVSGQLDIFRHAPVRPERKARAADPSTSHRAARAALPRQGTQRARILAAITASRDGLTYDGAAHATGIVGVSVSTRISELHRDGLIVQAGERETSAGGKATVWKAAA